MIDAIIRFSISQRLLVLLAVVGLILAGIFSFQKLPIDAVPDITNVQVQILTSAPALAPLEVERQITFPVEVGISGLPGVAEIRSVSKFGLSAVTVVFEEDVDTYFARQLILERLSQIRQDIPPEIGVPEMGPISTGLGEIYQYEIKPSSKGGADLTQLRVAQDWVIRRQLMGMPGVAEVNSYGGLAKQYQILLDPQRLQAYKLSIQDIVQAVGRNNENVGGAYIEHAGEQYILRGMGLAANVADIGNIVIRTGAEGVPIYLRQLAEINVGAAVRQGAVTIDGQGEAVVGIVMMLKGANSRTVVEEVSGRMKEIQRSLPAGVEVDPFYNRAELVDRTIKTVEHNLLEGAILVIVVLIALLGNWRGALLVASVIPLSMLFAVICMNAFKVSGNLMSLGAIDFGLIVDGAVVMVENTIRRLAEAQHQKLADEPKQTILSSCLEVGRPVVFAVVIIAMVYLPLLSLVGVEGKMFRPMALTVVFALIGSLLLCLTFIPAAMAYLFNGPVSEKESWLIRVAKERYKRGLDIAMEQGRVTVAVAVTLFVLSMIIFPMLGAEFIPRLDEGSMAIQIQQLPSVSLSQSVATSTAAERVMRKFPEVTKVVSKIGRAEVATDPMGVDAVDMYIGLKEPAQWVTARTREQLVEKMAAALEAVIPNANFSFSQPIELRTAELIAGVRSDIAIKIFGEDLDVLKEKGDEVAKVVRRVTGATDVKVEQIAGLPQLQIQTNRAAIARYGLNVEDVNNIVESLVVGFPTGTVFEGERRFDLVVKLNEGSSSDTIAIQNILLPAPNGGLIPLREVADVSVVEGPAQVSREDRHRRIGVELNVRGRDIGSFVESAKAAIAKEIQLPAGYYIVWGGQFENLQRASARLMIVVPIALMLIFILLLSTFGSVRQAILIYTGIPFAIVGGVFALALRGMPFSISAGVGFIALFGVAVLNGVVMVSYINSLRQEGMSLAGAVRIGAETRLRPVLMTALVASLGFIPMAISTTAGGEVQRPLATVVIGGIITSTILTLFILPSIYLWFESRGKKGPSDTDPVEKRKDAVFK